MPSSGMPTAKPCFLVSCVKAKTQLFMADRTTKEVKPITEGVHDYVSVALGEEGKLIAKRHSMLQPDEILLGGYRVGKSCRTFVRK